MAINPPTPQAASSSAPTQSSAPKPASPQNRPPVRAITIDPVRVLRQHWKSIMYWAIGGAIFAGIFQVGAQFIYPVYSGQVILRLRPQLGDAKEIFGGNADMEETVARLAQTEAQQMVMRDILVRAVTSKSIQKTKWIEEFVDTDGKVEVDDAVDDLEDTISSGHRRSTQFFALYWSAHEASDVPIVLNTVAETYLTELNTQRDQKFNGIKAVFVKKLKELDDAIDSSKTTTRGFIIERGIPSYDENSMQSQRGLEELQRLIADTTMELSLAKSQRGQIDAKLQGRLEPSQDDVRKAEVDPVLLQLSRDINDLTISMQSKKARFGPMHPEVRSGEQTLSSALAQKEKVVEDLVRRDLNGQFKTVTDRQGGLEDLLKKQTADYASERKKVEQLASQVAELEAMKDRQKRIEEERGVLANTIGELDLARARVDSIPVEIAQKCVTPREFAFPNWKVVLPGVWFAALALGIGLIFLREVLDQRVRFASELAGLAGGKVLGVVPDIADDEANPSKVDFVVRDASQSMLAESFRQISTNLLKAIADQGCAVVGVFSAMPESGVTGIITNLASSATVVGKRVLVIDCNFRRPGVAKVFDVSMDIGGLSDVLGGHASFDSVVQRNAYGIDVINAGQSRMIELFDTAKLTEVFTVARERYDLVLVDTPPAAIAAEAIVVANRLDASILVVRAMRDQRGLVTRLIGQLSAQKCRFIGAILNRPQQTAGGYYKKNAQLMARYATDTSGAAATNASVSSGPSPSPGAV